MRSIHFSILLCVSICLGGSFSVCFANNTYWISYNGRTDPDAENPPCCSKYLMKIDSLGNVLRPPVKVIHPLGSVFRPIFSAHTIANNGSRWINMWLPANRRLDDLQFAVFRAVIEKNSMRLASLSQTPFRMNDQFVIEASKKKQNNFLLLSVTEHGISNTFSTIKGFAISENGLALCSNWPLIAEDQNFSSPGLSSDGRILFYTLRVQHTFTRDRLIFQSLGDRGRPIGEPVVIDELRDLLPNEVTGILADSKRYLFFAGGGANTDPNLWLQLIDAKSLKKLGPRIFIAPGRVRAAADPLGQFVIYDGFPNLFFQALDVTGHPSGLPKLLSTGVEGDFDILKD